MAISVNQSQNQFSKTPIALNPRNFTSLKRTPWAGTSLAHKIKRSFATSETERIGESWEVSCDKDSPSTLAHHPHLKLVDLIAEDPEAYLSAELVMADRAQCEILIKLLNADDPLSLQIHPSDHNPSLTKSECGKPESWYVIDAKPGSGLYLGFKEPMPTQAIQSQLEAGTFQSSSLQFVEVKRGDFFEIEPHVPHAIGPGVVLLEPQRVLSGKSGKTWRLWDWNRKYNTAGELDLEKGHPRELHIKESMPLLDPKHQWGTDYVESLRRTPIRQKPNAGIEVEIFPPNEWYQLITVTCAKTSRIRINTKALFACMTIFHGKLHLRNNKQQMTLCEMGQSFFLPHQSLPLEAIGQDQESFFSLVIPAGKGVALHGGLVFD